MRSRDRAGEQESDDRRTTLREASCAQQQELRQQGKQDTNRSFMLSAVLLDMSANASFCFSRPSLTFSLFSRHLSVRAARAACQSTARMSGHAPCEQPRPFSADCNQIQTHTLWASSALASFSSMAGLEGLFFGESCSRRFCTGVLATGAGDLMSMSKATGAIVVIVACLRWRRAAGDSVKKRQAAARRAMGDRFRTLSRRAGACA